MVYALRRHDVRMVYALRRHDVRTIALSNQGKTGVQINQIGTCTNKLEYKSTKLAPLHKQIEGDCSCNLLNNWNILNNAEYRSGAFIAQELKTQIPHLAAHRWNPWGQYATTGWLDRPGDSMRRIESMGRLDRTTDRAPIISRRIISKGALSQEESFLKEDIIFFLRKI